MALRGLPFRGVSVRLRAQGAAARTCWRQPRLLSTSIVPRGFSTSTGQRNFDVAIVGGGVIGSSVALHLAAQDASLSIAVLERDVRYTHASAPRSVGGIRQQFSLPTNIELSLYGIQFLKSDFKKLLKCDTEVDTNVQFQENGYLVLATPGDGEASLRENHKVQQETGATWITLLDQEALQRRFPWLHTDDLGLGAFGECNEGYFDPWLLLQAMRQGAVEKGVTYIPQEVVGLCRSERGGAVTSLTLANGEAVSAGIVVNSAGAHGGRIVELCGADVTPLPVVPKKRCVWQVKVALDNEFVVPPANTPLIVDPSGAYVRSEGPRGRFLCGMSPSKANDPDSSDLACEDVDHELFEEHIWPALAARIPAFEALKVESSWAGLYEYNTLDQNGVVDWHPEVPNMLMACGFSGHGLQQSPGVGRACAELVVHGGFRTIDLSPFSFGRIARGEPILERGIY